MKTSMVVCIAFLALLGIPSAVIAQGTATPSAGGLPAVIPISRFRVRRSSERLVSPFTSSSRGIARWWPTP